MKLREYFDKNAISPCKFSKLIGVTPATISKAMRGGNLNLITGVKIEVATDGQVTCQDLVPIEILKTNIGKKRLKSKEAENEEKSKKH